MRATENAERRAEKRRATKYSNSNRSYLLYDAKVSVSDPDTYDGKTHQFPQIPDKQQLM
jgi:hypothetical protein